VFLKRRLQNTLDHDLCFDLTYSPYPLIVLNGKSQLLEKVISKLKTLPTNEQDAIATMILDELEDERRWDESFARSPDLLAKLAAEAMTEYRAGKTQELDPEKL
jgi:hypothetical protein